MKLQIKEGRLGLLQYHCYVSGVKRACVNHKVGNPTSLYLKQYVIVWAKLSIVTFLPFLGPNIISFDPMTFVTCF